MPISFLWKIKLPLTSPNPLVAHADHPRRKHHFMRRPRKRKKSFAQKTWECQVLAGSPNLANLKGESTDWGQLIRIKYRLGSTYSQKYRLGATYSHKIQIRGVQGGRSPPCIGSRAPNCFVLGGGFIVRLPFMQISCPQSVFLGIS